MAGIFSLLVVVTLSLIVTRTAVALTCTGLSWEAARFQARSAFTGFGFTTSEAEGVVNHPVRRRIVMLLMLLGNAGIVSAVSTLILSFVGTGESWLWLIRLAMILGGLAAIILVTKIPWVDRKMHQAIEWVLRKWTKLEVRDYVQLLGLTGDYGVSEMAVKQEDWLAGRTLREVKLNKEGVIVLGIHRKDRSYIGTPSGGTKILPGDTLILYGRSEQLAELDKRCSGAEGDRLHDEACAHRDRIRGLAI